MATVLSALPGQPDLHAEAVDQVLLIRTDEIDRGERLRDIDMVWASALGQVMKREGQRTPIEVCRLSGSNRWTLVAGGHRHAGAEIEEIAYLTAIQVSADRDDRRMREVSENLWRRDLDPIDRAAFIAEAVAIHKRRAGIDPAAEGRVTSANARWQTAVQAEADDATDTMAVAYGWSEEVGDQIGLSSRSVRRDLLLYRRLVPSVVATLRAERHPILTNATQLRALAKLEEGKQQRVVTRLTLHGAKTVPDALAQLEGSRSVADPEARRLSAFICAFQRMSLAEKKGAFAHLLPMLPSGCEPAGTVSAEAYAALNTAFDFFLELEKWDAASPVGLIAENAQAAKTKVQLALFSVNGARRPA